MTVLINPAIVRLGITRTWVINCPFTISTNDSMLETYRIQSYLFCLNQYCNWIFVNKLRKQFYMQLFVIYDRIKLNFAGFSSLQKSNKSKMVLHFCFFDFNAHVHNYNNHHLLFNRVIRSLRFKLKDLFLPFKDLQFDKNLYAFYGFFYTYTKNILMVRRFFKFYFRRFRILLRKIFFKKAFIRVHKHFFINFPVVCIFQLTPYVGKITAKFLAVYLERKVRTGTRVNRALRLVHKYLRRIRHVIGYRVICSGRFQRGKKGGFTSRAYGVFSYGRFSKTHILDYACTYSNMKTGICGFKVWVCSSPYIDNINYIDFSGKWSRKL
jgi:hypothetical protein